jgi:hypothetical protein
MKKKKKKLNFLFKFFQLQHFFPQKRNSKQTNFSKIQKAKHKKYHQLKQIKHPKQDL